MNAPERTPNRRRAARAAIFATLLATPFGLAAPDADAAGGAELEAPPAVNPVDGAAGSNGIEALRAQLAQLLGSGAGRSGEWGLMAFSLDRGDTLFAFNHDRPLAPASNQKIFTTAAALHHLGPEFRYPTFLLASGGLTDGVLDGDLILYGTGDPSFSDRHLDSPEAPLREFARSLRARGVHTVRGDVVGDGTFFHGPSRREAWSRTDLNEWYAAPVSALSFNENMVTLRISPSRPGLAPRILTQPAGADVPLLNRGQTVAGRARATLMLVRDDPDDPIELRGEMAPGQADVWRRLTVSDPPAFAASILLRVLREEGIRVEGTSRGTEASRVTGRTLVAPAFDDAEDTWTVAVHHSPPLSELIEVVNKRSHNLYSELLYRSVGRIALGDGSFEGGSRALTDYLVDVAGVPREGLHMDDGSGLSRMNRAPASAFVRVLAHMEAGEHGEVFRASLPEAGNRRELSRMFQSAAAGNLRAKTGTIRRVSALSGIVRSADGEAILFSILANEVPSSGAAKRLEDRIGIQLASFARPVDAAPVVAAGAGSAPGAGDR